MSMKRWDHAPGTCRAVVAVYGPQVVVCHPCRRYVAMPPLERPFDPCPFVCRWCGTRGSIKDAGEAPADYVQETRAGREFIAPKLRWRPTR